MAARFDAFLSYSRRASTTLATELQGGVERFAKPWNRLRAVRVFRDDASMSANVGLWGTIERALTEADWFVLIASPQSAASEYVTKEIEWWVTHKSADRILLVLDEGEIWWDVNPRDPTASGRGDFDWERSTAINRALSGVFAEEPRWVDLSWFEREGSLGRADPRWQERVADVAAAVRFAERDELIGENVRERRRAQRLLRAGIVGLSGLLVASLVATVIAVVNGNTAAEQARIALARQLAAQAISLSTTDLQLASLLAVEAHRLADDLQTQSALFQLANASPALVRTLPVGATVTATAVGADGVVVTGDVDGTVSVWTDGERDDPFALPGAVDAVARSADGTVVAAVSPVPAAVTVAGPSGSGSLDLADSGSTAGAPVNSVTVSSDGGIVIIGDRNTWSTVYLADGGGYRAVGTVARGGAVGISDDGTEFTTMDRAGTWARIALPVDGGPGTPSALAVIDEGWHALGVAATASAVSADGTALAGAIDGGVNYAVWNTVGSVSGGGAVEGDPPDRIATSEIAGSFDIALDETGYRLATMTDGVIYVSEARDPGALPTSPIVLDGAGEVGPDSLAFRGDHLVSSSGDHVLVWDLAQAGRLTTEFTAPVPEGCTACGPQTMRLNAAGTRALMSALGGGGVVAVDLGTQQAVSVDPDGELGLSGADWFGDDAIIGFSSARQELVVLGGDDFDEPQLTVPAPDDIVTALAIRSDGRRDGRTTYLTDTGSVRTIETATGEIVAQSDALVGVGDGSAPTDFGIAADQSTAFVVVLGDGEGAGIQVVDVAGDAVVYGVPSAVGAEYDADSRLHVFVDGMVGTLDPQTGVLVDAHPAEVDTFPTPAMSADARFAATGGSDGAVALLDIARWGAEFGSFAVPVENNRHSVSQFTADGSALVTSIQAMGSLGRPGTVRTLDLDVDDWVGSACALAGRDLTPDEWRQYVGSEPPADLGCRR